MKCPFCRHHISTKAKFCENCGEMVQQDKKICKNCNAPNELDAKTCSHCQTEFSLLSYRDQVGREGLADQKNIEKIIGKYKVRGEKTRLEGRQQEAEDLFQEGLDLLQSELGETHSPALINANAFFQYGLARIHETRGDYQTALTYLEKAQALLLNLSDLPSRILLAGVYQRIGWNKFREGFFYDAAMEYYQGLGLLGENTENKQGGMLFQGLGVLFRSLGHNEDAEANLQKSIQIRKKLNDLNGASADLINLGVLYVQQGDYSIGEDFYHEAYQYKTEIRETEGRAICQANLGYIYYEQGRYPEAIRHINQAIEILGAGASPWILPICYGYLARVALATDALDEAETSLAKAEALVGGGHDKINRARLLELQAMIHHRRGALSKARKCFRQAEQLFGSTTLGFDGAVCYLHYARLLLELAGPGKKKKAGDGYRQDAQRLVRAAAVVFSHINNRKYLELTRNLQQALSPKRREKE